MKILAMECQVINFYFFKQKTAYEMRISYWSSDVCSSDLFREHDELFTETSWLSVMAGQGIEAAGYHPAADLLADDETLTRLAHLRDVVAHTAAAMPTQQEFLRQERSLAEQPLARAS